MSMVSELRECVKAAHDALYDAANALKSNYTSGRHVSFVHEAKANGNTVVLQGEILRSWFAVQDDWDRGCQFFAMLEVRLDKESQALVGKPGTFETVGPYVVNVLEEARDVTLIS